MDDLRDLMRATVTADAAATRGDDLADALGGAVRGRVRRRRAARAAGIGSMAAVSVGAVAFGAAKVPTLVAEPISGGLVPSAGECVDGYFAVSGAELYGAYAPVPGASPTTHGIDISEVRAGETWVIYDDVAQQPAAEFTVLPGGNVEVIETSGVTYEIAPNDEGLYVFEAPGGGWVTFEAGSDVAFGFAGEAPEPTEISASTEATAPGTGVLCVPTTTLEERPDLASTETAPKPSALATASPPERDPSPAPSASIAAATATTPYQCGFAFPSTAHGTGQWRITGTEWLTADEAAQALTDSFGSVDAVWVGEIRQDVLRIDVDGTLLTGGVPGESGTFEPGTGDSLLTSHAPFESTSISVVGVRWGEVVTTTDPQYPERQKGLIVDRDESGAAAHAWLFDLRDLQDCPGEEPESFDLYAVSAAAAVDADGTVTGPVYSWQRIEGP
ncbi:hypothetical protein [Demequina sp. NBRC 110056]|uniref:hypothetical protein n=1 Tax=Demequina sp. NBRC 110056 TaxID=1570345 RepID=UPI000A05C982|nr:hypothetical protein [Demequina sp. NBRC 110056]